MAHFELIHGAWHRAAHWKYLQLELDQLGHSSTAIDMPIDTPSTPQDWAIVVADGMKERVESHLVAHSMGALVAPLVAELVPVRSIIYVAPAFRRAGHSMMQDFQDGVSADMLIGGFGFEDKGDGYTKWTNSIATIETFYHDVPATIVFEAVKNLRKQYDYFTDVSPQSDWPDVPVQVIYGTEDPIINPKWVIRVAKDWFGVEAIPFPSGHTPFIAKPAEFAHLLDQLVQP